VQTGAATTRTTTGTARPTACKMKQSEPVQPEAHPTMQIQRNEVKTLNEFESWFRFFEAHSKEWPSALHNMKTHPVALQRRDCSSRRDHLSTQCVLVGIAQC